MARSKMSLTDKDTSIKVTAVWLIQNDKRFLLNYFNRFEMARSYAKAFEHMKINGEILIGEISLLDLIKNV